jgi:hypothetical protein
MKRILLLCTVLLSFLGASALLAAPAPQTADVEQLRQAIFQPAPAAALSPLAEALPMFVSQCEPPTRFVCVNKQCQCGVQCGSCGIASFTCDPNTGASNCKCKTC